MYYIEKYNKINNNILDDDEIDINFNYGMGWKFTNKTKNSKNSKNSKNNKNFKNKSKNIKNIKNNNENNNINFDDNYNKIIPTEYNIYKKYPDYFPEIINQQNINCCVPICISTIYYYLSFKQNNTIKMRISSLYLYYLIKYKNNELDSDNDSGSTIIESLKMLQKKGCCPEFIYNYIPSNFNKIPDKKLLKLANKCKLLSYTKITRYNIKEQLLNNNPVICGIKIFNSFHSKKTIRTGIIKLPEKIDYLLGGHSIVIIGYDDHINSFIFINSWGITWGNNGIGFIPYIYINNKNYSDEFFILNKINNTQLLLYNKIIYKSDIIVALFLQILILVFTIYTIYKKRLH